MFKRSLIVAVIAILFLGLALESQAKKKQEDDTRVDPAMWNESTGTEAGEALLEVAMALAGGGSWEEIAVGRVYYLSGNREKGQEIFDRYLSGKRDAGDLVRIARVYNEADEWDKAKPLYLDVLEKEPRDQDWLAEFGTYSNLNGEAEEAQALFDRSFDISDTSLRNTLAAAGSFLGVRPKK